MTGSVLVLWADSRSANLGVRVLAEGASKLAQLVWGEEVRVTHQDFESGPCAVAITPRNVLRELIKHSGPISALLREHDVVLDTGAGDSLADIYGFKRLFAIVGVQHLARREKVPVVLAPQTIGPFRSRSGRVLGRIALRGATRVYARDEESAKAARLLGREVDASASDVVFLLPSVGTSGIDAHRPSGPAPDVLVNVSGLLWSSNDHGSASNYRNTIERIVTTILDAGRMPRFICHVLSNPSLDDDTKIVDELISLFPSLEPPIVPTSLEEVRLQLSQSNFVIASRMHAALNALSLGVPSVSLAYSRKFRPLMRDIGWQHVLDPYRLTERDITALKSLLANENLTKNALGVGCTAHELLAGAIRDLRGAMGGVIA